MLTEEDVNYPVLSIVMPNLHSPIVGKCLDSVLDQRIQASYEIIIVGQDRYNQVQERLKADRMVTFIETQQPVSSARARNIGIREAKGEIIAMIDSDCIASTTWLEGLYKKIEQPGISVVGGGVTFPDDNFWTLVDNLATFYEYLDTSPPGLRQQLPSLNLCIRKNALLKVGLFDERFPLAAGEDADLTTRLRLAGYELWFKPEAVITHLPQRRTWKSVFTHAFNFGKFSIKVDERYQEVLKISSIFRKAWLIKLAAPILAAGVAFRIVLSRGGRRWWYAWPVFFAIKIAWCLGAAERLDHKIWPEESVV